MTAPAVAPQLPPGFAKSYIRPYTPQPSEEVLEEVKGMSSETRDRIRLRCKKDRYFLASGILGYKDVNPYTHGPFLRALEDKSKQRRTFLMHRGSLKSTLGTVTDGVGEALNDPEECRILIVNEVEENAIKFISEIKAHFENNKLLHLLFPELIPKRFGGPGSKWSTTKACLPRSSAYGEWTWRGVGVGSAIVSQHFTHIKCDDLIGFDASQSAAAMKFAIAFAKSMEPLLVSMDENIIDFIGTRWAIYDLYREMLKIYGDDMAYFARQDIERVPDWASDELLLQAGFKPEQLETVRGTYQPIFPRKFSLKRLERLKNIDPVLYYAQFKNNPIADGIKDFHAEKLNWCDLDKNGHVVYRDIHTGQLRRWRRDQLDIVMTCDPNSGELKAPDFPSIVVSAFSSDDQMFTLDSWSLRVDPEKYVDMIFEKYMAWRPRVLGIEKAGMAQTQFYFKKKCRDLKISPNVVPLLHKNREKGTRIRKGLGPIINGGRMFVRKHQNVLQHQIRFHPDLDNDDEIDAAAYATEIAIRPASQQEQDDEDKVVGAIMSGRNKLSGY